MTQLILAFFEYLKKFGKQEKVDQHPETAEKKDDNTKRVLNFLFQQFDFRYSHQSIHFNTGTSPNVSSSFSSMKEPSLQLMNPHRPPS